MQGGFFTTALQLIRAAWSLFLRLFQFFTSLGGGLVSEIVALALIWIIVVWGVPIIEKIIDGIIWLIRLWR